MGLEDDPGKPLEKKEKPKTLKEELASITERIESDHKNKPPIPSVYDHELVSFSKRLAAEKPLTSDQVGVLVSNMLALRPFH